jgi:hypothetical protein
MMLVVMLLVMMISTEVSFRKRPSPWAGHGAANYLADIFWPASWSWRWPADIARDLRIYFLN